MTEHQRVRVLAAKSKLLLTFLSWTIRKAPFEILLGVVLHLAAGLLQAVIIHLVSSNGGQVKSGDSASSAIQVAAIGLWFGLVPVVMAGAEFAVVKAWLKTRKLGNLEVIHASNVATAAVQARYVGSDFSNAQRHIAKLSLDLRSCNQRLGLAVRSLVNTVGLILQLLLLAVALARVFPALGLYLSLGSLPLVLVISLMSSRVTSSSFRRYDAMNRQEAREFRRSIGADVVFPSEESLASYHAKLDQANTRLFWMLFTPDASRGAAAMLVALMFTATMWFLVTFDSGKLKTDDFFVLFVAFSSFLMVLASLSKGLSSLARFFPTVERYFQGFRLLQATTFPSHIALIKKHLSKVQSDGHDS